MVAKMIIATLVILAQTEQLSDSQMPLRVPRGLLTTNYFQGLPPGFTEKWYQLLRQPCYCRMNLCHGTCADPARFASNLYQNSTPCVLRTFNNLIYESTTDCCQFTQTAQMSSKIK
jgi:hypothetical protein